MRHHIIFILFAVLFFISVCTTLSIGQESGSSLNRILPVDRNITIGKLENGITYYIRMNKKPEKRAELRLAVNTGSVLEDDDQQGIAHFIEHMAFNGTRNFARHEIVDYLESIGMRFGPDINVIPALMKRSTCCKFPPTAQKCSRKRFKY